MRYLFLAVSMLVLSTIAGCVWPPDSTPTGYNNNTTYYSGFIVRHISERTLSGTESLVTLVSPASEIADYYYSYYYPDSIRYIIVNGDTAYRRPVYLLPAVYDSSAPYRVDGTANFVTIVYPSFTISDTTYEGSLFAQITAPAYGDTVSRVTDALFSYQTNTSQYSYPSGSFSITDSVSFYSQALNYGNMGTLDFPVNDLASFHPGTLWADLKVLSNNQNDGVFISSGPPYYQIYLSHEVDLDRIVAYPLK